MFGFLKGKAAEAAKEFTGTKDLLEGCCAISAHVAAATGGIDDNEYAKALSVIKNNAIIGPSYDTAQIESVFGKMAAKTNTRSGKAELKEEVRQVIARDKTGKLGQAMMLIALDVADEGGIDDAETAILKEYATICNVNYEKMLAA